MLRAIGRNVEVQNYIDNTGVQVADVVVAFEHLEKKSPADVQKLIETTRFDYLCWDLYARMSSYYAEHPEALEWRKSTLHAIESGEGATSELAHLVSDAIVRAHLATMYRLNIEYDVLPRESEILHLKFWAQAFELLKERKAIYFENEGKNKGCWVMPASAFKRGSSDEDERRRQQGDRAVERHRDLCRQGHRLSALEIRLAGQGFLLSPVAHLSGWAPSVGIDLGAANRIAGIRPRRARL